MSFSSPEFLLLIPAMALAGWFWPKLRLFSPLRAIILVLATLGLADPSIRKQRNCVDIHVLLDRSESTGDEIDAGLPEWKKLLLDSKPGRHDSLHFINYAADFAAAEADGPSFTGSRSLTRTGLAISSVLSSLDKSRPARVLLFTDGYSTEPLDEVGEQLRDMGVPLDFRLIGNPAGPDFRISRISVPEGVQAGEPFPLTVTIKGNADGRVPLVIRRDGVVLAETEAEVRERSAVLEFTDRITQAGGHRYDVEIRPGKDSRPGNNRWQRWIGVRGGPRILLVTSYADDPLAKVLSSRDFEVQTVTDPSLLQPGMLSGAKALVINNVPAHLVPEPFLKAVDFFVRNQGGGFLMAGGKMSFGAGGYFESAIDKLLPVSLEMREEHRKLSLALGIVMDRSGSMAVGVAGGKTKMDLANQGAADAIALLGPMDEVTVFAVDSAPVKVVPLTQIAQRKNELSAKVRKVQSMGGGIFVYEGLDAAWRELSRAKASTRHVILFSDAADSEEPGNYKELIATMRKNNCTVSVIGLGTKADPDAALLQDIANRGDGRIFFSDKPADIPKIFAQETVSVARSAFLTDPVGTSASGRWSEISPKPVDWLAQVDGYNLSYARPDATVSLASKDEYTAPLVAHARRGLGRTMAVSFPLGGEYSRTARAWPGYGDFLQTVGRFLAGDESPPGIALQHKLDGTRLNAELRFDPELWEKTFSQNPPLARFANDTEGTVFDVPWQRIEPGRYSIRLDLAPGSVLRGAVQVGEQALSIGPLSIGSPLEWALDPERIDELRSVSAQTGGRELVDLSQAWLRPRMIAKTSLQIPLMLALLLLIVAEALLTRTGWKLPSFGRERRSSPLPRANWLPKWRRQKPAPAATAEPQSAKVEVAPQPKPTDALGSSLRRAKRRK